MVENRETVKEELKENQLQDELLNDAAGGYNIPHTGGFVKDQVVRTMAEKDKADKTENPTACINPEGNGKFF